jgi:hypothetical protein
MFIYDRAGSLVYKTSDRGKPWDGRKANSGEVYAAGSIFIWTVVKKDEKGNEKTYTGFVTIIK